MDFTSHDGEKIWYKIWRADAPRAVIQIMTGLAETADYYEEMAKYLNQAGYSVALHEYRQHGRTRAGYGDGNLFRNYARDGAQLCSMLRASRPGLPVVLFAHSLGTRSTRKWKNGTASSTPVPPARSCLRNARKGFFLWLKIPSANMEKTVRT